MFMFACRLDSGRIYMDSDAYGYGSVALSFLVFVKDKEYFD